MVATTAQNVAPFAPELPAPLLPELPTPLLPAPPEDVALLEQATSAAPTNARAARCHGAARRRDFGETKKKWVMLALTLLRRRFGATATLSPERMTRQNARNCPHCAAEPRPHVGYNPPKRCRKVLFVGRNL
jgi:hypothetical protein